MFQVAYFDKYLAWSCYSNMRRKKQALQESGREGKTMSGQSSADILGTGMYNSF